MFKSARWRSDKNRVKAEFKLQFHATQVSKLGVDALTLSVIPADTAGKPTIRLNNAPVRDRSCRWENPVYESVKFVRDPKTLKINDKIYKFVVSTGWAKAGVLGEASFNFADYAESTKTSFVSLPLKNSTSDAILHVSMQRLQENAYERETGCAEDIADRSKDSSVKICLSNADSDEGIRSTCTDEEEITNNTPPNVELSGNSRASSGSDITLLSTESSSGLDTPREIGVGKNYIAANFSSPRLSTPISEEKRLRWEWSIGSHHRVSSDDSGDDPLPIEEFKEHSESKVEKLKAKLVVLARRADVSEMELQTLRKQIVKESKRGQELVREITSLKEERDSLKSECEKLKKNQIHMDDAKFKNKLQFEGGDLRALLDETRQELNYEKDLNANLRLQLQKTQESNSELILAIQDLEEMLEQKSSETYRLNVEDLKRTTSQYEVEDDGDEEQLALEEIVNEHRNANETYLLEQKVIDLCGELQLYRKDKDDLHMQIEQLELDYEILKQENHDISYKLEQSQLQEQLKMQYECMSPSATMNELEIHIESLEKELEQQSKEFSNSLATVKELEAHSKMLEEELEKQTQRFEGDLEDLTHAKVEQEQRAIRAEEALRMTRWKNAHTVEKLQEEFRRLSVQMASTFDANEKVAVKALAEASELRLQRNQLEETLQNAKEELQSVRDYHEAKVTELSNQIDAKTSEIEQLSSELDVKSKQIKHQKKQEEEISISFSQEILKLKSEIETLTAEKNNLLKQVEQEENLKELEKMKTFVKQTEIQLDKENKLLSTIALAKEEAEKSKEELQRMTRLNDENETTVELLQSQTETLKAQCNNLKNFLLEDEIEKEKLRKQVFQLKGDLKKKEEALSTLEKKLKHDGTKITPKPIKSPPVAHSTKEIASLREKIKLLEGQIKVEENDLKASARLFLDKEKDLVNKIEELENSLKERSPATIKSNEEISVKKDVNDDQLLNELALLKEQNRSMEIELKEMQERYSEISLKFAEVEGERQQLVMTLRNVKNSKKV